MLFINNNHGFQLPRRMIAGPTRGTNGKFNSSLTLTTLLDPYKVEPKSDMRAAQDSKWTGTGMISVGPSGEQGSSEQRGGERDKRPESEGKTTGLLHHCP
jgi:hypothetical protein